MIKWERLLLEFCFSDLIFSENRSDCVDRVTECSCRDDCHEENVYYFLVCLRSYVPVANGYHCDKGEVETEEVLCFPMSVVDLFVFKPAVLVVIELCLPEEDETASTEVSYKDDEREELQ